MKKDAKKHIQIQCSENIGRIYLDKKCGSSPRTWLVEKLFMKFYDGQTYVGQILHRLPRQVRLVVTHPIHLVLKFAGKISENRKHLGTRKNLGMFEKDSKNIFKYNVPRISEGSI